MADKISNEQKKLLIENLTKSLPMLRAKLGINQTELCERIGVTRQTLTLIESGKREMTWMMFVSLVLIFMQNEETKTLLPILGVDTEELRNFFSFNSDRTSD